MMFRRRRKVPRRFRPRRRRRQRLSELLSRRPPNYRCILRTFKFRPETKLPLIIPKPNHHPRPHQKTLLPLTASPPPSRTRSAPAPSPSRFWKPQPAQHVLSENKRNTSTARTSPRANPTDCSSDSCRSPHRKTRRSCRTSPEVTSLKTWCFQTNFTVCYGRIDSLTATSAPRAVACIPPI